ncbi:MAG: hypothetical protein KatS3mg108_2417 [Isosphaeraceae bacterium]|jgi:hypothetical protein|nr:MAG: hypothetical protein KatS3mg108_2417 [Isosphaeraceae bacterium]
MAPDRAAAHRADLGAALTSLDRLGRERPELSAPAQTLRRILTATFDHPVAAVGPIRHDAAPPFFVQATPRFDHADLHRRARAVCQVLESEHAAAGRLRLALTNREIDLADYLVHALVTGEPPAVPTAIDAALLESVAQLVAMPALAPLTTRVDPPPGSHHVGLACPYCGAPPLLAEARGLEQRRLMRCGRCAASWPMPRLDCPACAQATLQVFRVEDQDDRYRLLACGGCDARLKLVTTLVPLSPPALLVADLASVHLDLIGGPAERPEPPG